jgi:fructose-1,6-bisphosphatase
MLPITGYTIYGSSTQMVLTFGNGVNIFTHDQGIGEFVLTRPNVRPTTNANRIHRSARSLPPARADNTDTEGRHC